MPNVRKRTSNVWTMLAPVRPPWPGEKRLDPSIHQPAAIRELSALPQPESQPHGRNSAVHTCCSWRNLISGNRAAIRCRQRTGSRRRKSHGPLALRLRFDFRDRREWLRGDQERRRKLHDPKTLCGYLLSVVGNPLARIGFYTCSIGSQLVSLWLSGDIYGAPWFWHLGRRSYPVDQIARASISRSYAYDACSFIRRGHISQLLVDAANTIPAVPTAVGL